MGVVYAGRSATAAVAVAVVSVFVLLIGGKPAAASGCSPTTHCYGDAVAGISGVQGVAVDITPSCLTVPADRIVTNEAWLFQAIGNTTYWVEAGYMQLGAGAVAGRGTT